MTVVATAALAVAGVAVAQDMAPSSSKTEQAANLEHQNTVLRRQLQRERTTHRAAIRKERRERRQLARSFERQLRTNPRVRHALKVAAATYGVSEARLTRIAACESTLRPGATSGRHVGLFQFGTPLWNATPYRDFDRSDPYASSLAASWAFSRGMDRHWPVCSRR